MNVPCLVLDWDQHWIPELRNIIKVSTATEWHPSFGYKFEIKNKGYNLDSIVMAMLELNKNYFNYNPRKVIEKDYNLVAGAKNYLNILEKLL